MVDGDEIAGFQNDQSEDYDEALARVQENINLTGVRNKILFTGKWKNDSKVETVSLTNFIKTDEYSGEELSIGFYISYLLDVIDILEGDVIHICINDQNSGCVIQDNQDQDSTFVIMPMRV